MKVWYCKNFLSYLDLVKAVDDNVGRWCGGGGRVNKLFIDLNKLIVSDIFFEELMKAIPVQ